MTSHPFYQCSRHNDKKMIKLTADFFFSICVCCGIPYQMYINCFFSVTLSLIILTIVRLCVLFLFVCVVLGGGGCLTCPQIAGSSSLKMSSSAM